MPLVPFAAGHFPLKRAMLLTATVAVLALGGCAKGPLDTLTTASIAGQPAAGADPQQQMQYWGDRYQKNEKDRDAELNYSAALRQTGANDQAVAVLQKAVIYYPNDRDILAAYGKALAAAGQLSQALDAVQRAQTPDRPDFKLMSTEASILDQMGNSDAARKLHVQAMQGAPTDPAVVSNYGMSYVLTGELPQAEALLKKALALPGADGRVRQNLALVVGLEGRFDEAQKIASADLPPDQAAQNVAYLKQMLAQQNTWQALQNGGAPAKTPAAKSG